MKIERFNDLMGKLKAKQGEAQAATCSVIVGYTANYALAVHENIEMKWKGKPRSKGRGFYWDPQGQAQAKFLEQPAREGQSTMARIVREAMRRGATLVQALLMAGMWLQRQSMMLAPVDTGNLRASAFTREEES